MLSKTAVNTPCRTAVGVYLSSPNISSKHVWMIVPRLYLPWLYYLLDKYIQVLMGEFTDLFMFSGILLVIGFCECLSSWKYIHLDLKHACYSKTCVWPTECSPKGRGSMLRALVGDFSVFMQNNYKKRNKILKLYL